VYIEFKIALLFVKAKNAGNKIAEIVVDFGSR